MKITPERFTTIIASYGSHPEHWPAEERAAMAAYLVQNPGQQAMLAEERALDDLLERYPIAVMSGLEHRILEHARKAAQQSVMDRILDWLLPHSGRILAWIWRPALVACLPVVCGILLADYFSFGIDGTQHSWQEELYLLSLNDYAESVE